MEQTFEGGIFHETLADGRAGGTIELLPAAISARTPDGESFLIPYRECQVEVGGFSGRVVLCRNEDRSLTIFCEDKKIVAALSLASSGRLDESLAIGRKQQRRDSRRGFVLGVTLLVGMIALLVGGYFGVRAGAGAAIMAMPIRIDQEIGTAAIQSMDLGGPVLNDEVTVAAIQKMVDRLAPNAAIPELEFRVQVVDSPQVNAFALPGGNIVVYTGLIDDARRPEQVAAVIAHEMSHATLRHGMQRIGQSLGIYAAITLLIGDASGLIGAGVDIFQAASINSYSREHENEADAEGIRMLHAAAIDPAGMAEFFTIMKHDHGDLPGIFSWVSTHPDHGARIESVQALVADLPAKQYRPLDLDWEAVQKRVRTNAANKNAANQNAANKIDTKQANDPLHAEVL